MKIIEEFNTKIERDGKFFVATIIFKDGRKLVTQGENILNCYDMIADILKIRCDDDVKGVKNE